MALRKILELGDETLRKVCRPVTAFDAKLATLLEDMAETMYAAPGVGLAAPQIGLLRRVVVIDVGEGLVELINPEITSREGEQRGYEGCLSVPGKMGEVVRPYKVTVKAQDRHGDPIELVGEEFFARAICHELDHLDGHIYVDFVEGELYDQED